MGNINLTHTYTYNMLDFQKIKMVFNTVSLVALFVLFFSTMSYAQTHKELDLPDFHSISLNSAYNVTLRQSNKQEVAVTVEEDIWGISKLHVEDGVLHIDIEQNDTGSKKSVWQKMDNIKIMPTMKVAISMVSIKKLIVNGSGTIIAENSVNASNMSLEMNGTGKIIMDLKGQNTNVDMYSGGEIELSGFCTTLKANVAGSGTLKAFNLEAKHANAKVRGESLCQINVSETLDGNVLGNGELAHKGETKNVKQSVMGRGKINRAY